MPTAVEYAVMLCQTIQACHDAENILSPAVTFALTGQAYLAGKVSVHPGTDLSGIAAAIAAQTSKHELPAPKCFVIGCATRPGWTSSTAGSTILIGLVVQAVQQLINAVTYHSIARQGGYYQLKHALAPGGSMFLMDSTNKLIPVV